MKERYIHILKYLVLLISVASVIQWLSISIGNTFVWWTIESVILCVCYKLKPNKQIFDIKPIKCWGALLVLNAIYGAMFMAENYWDWKALTSNFLIFSMPLASCVFCSKERLTPILAFWFRWGLVLFLVLFPFMLSDAVGRFLVPCTFVALFFPELTFRMKVVVLVSYLITMYYGVDSRSDMLKFTICMLFAILAQWKYFWNHSYYLLKFARLFFFASPFVFSYLLLTDEYNVFQMEEFLGEDTYYLTDTQTGEQVSLVTDTRTFIYEEELSSAIRNDYVIQGRSMARGYESPFFSWMVEEQMYGDFHAGERYASEVSILNVFNYFGLIGVTLYFIIFWFATKKALFESKNVYLKIIGLYVSFRWTFAFVEDFSRFDLNMLFLWIMIGICYSPYWRELSDEDIKKWVRQI